MQSITDKMFSLAGSNLVNVGNETFESKILKFLLSVPIKNKKNKKIAYKLGSVKPSKWWRRNVISVDPQYVYLHFLNYKFTAFYTNERILNDLFEEWFELCKQREQAIDFEDVWFSCNGVPLRGHLHMSDYNLASGCTITVNIRIRGGQSTIEPQCKELALGQLKRALDLSDNIFLQFGDKIFVMPYYNDLSVRAHLQDWEILMCMDLIDFDFTFDDKWLSFHGRPLRLDINFEEQGILPNATLTLLVRLRGGAQSRILLPTYSIIQECENEVLEQLVFQTTQSLAFLNECTHRLTNSFGGLDIPDIVEDFLCLIVSLIDARKWRTIYIAVSQFLKKYIKVEGSFFLFLVEKIKNMFPVALQSGTTFDSSLIEGFVSNFKQFRESDSSKKVYKTIMYIFSLAAFGSELNDLRFNKTYEELFKIIYKRGSDFITVFLDGLIFLCKRGYQCYMTGSLSPIWHHEDEYTKFIDDVMECKRNVGLMTDPETHGLNIFAFQAKVENLIEKGDAMVKFAYKDSKAERAYLSRMLNDLKMIKSELTTKQAAQKSRPAPFSLLIFGGSSIGKSNFTQILFQHFGKIFDLPIESEFLYTRNAVDQYWSGFTSIQWGIILDDIGFMKPTAAPQGDPSLLEMLQVVNNVPYNPNQAELEMKGRTPLRCKLVLATSNVEDLNAYAYFACPLAVRRRLPFVIELKPKPEYSSNGVMLDPDLVPPNNENYPDLWVITVKRVVPADDNRAILREEATYTDINEFLAWYGQAAKKFDAVQKRALEAVSLTKSLRVCRECCYAQNMCKCSTLQSGSRTMKIIAFFLRHPILIRVIYNMYKFRVFQCLFLYIVMYFDKPEAHHTAMTLIGRRRFAAFQPPKHVKTFLAFASAASLMYICSLFFRKEDEITKQMKSAVLQGANQSKLPKPKANERVNVWYNEEMELTSADIGRASLSLVGKEDVAEEIISRNIVYIEVKCKNGSGKIEYQNALCIKGNIYVANNHLFKEEGEYEIVLMSNAHRSGVDTKVKYVYILLV
jgi:hypothetical protein